MNNGLTLGNAGSYTAGSYSTLTYTLASGNNVEAINLGPGGSPTGTLTLNSSGAWVNIMNAIPTTGTYTLMNFASQTGSGAFSLSSTTPGITTLPAGVDTYTLIDNANSLVLQVTGTPVPNVAYFKGGAPSNAWNDISAAPATNWSLDKAGTIDAGNTPSTNTDVIFSANNQTGAVATISRYKHDDQ